MDDNTSYQVIEIVLLESSFRREPIIDFNDLEFQNNVDVEITSAKDEANSVLNVLVQVSFSYKKNDLKVVESIIKMQGMFKYPKDPSVSTEIFGKVNGPAIVFPFIREHLAGLTLKAMINPVLLPSYNFAKAAKAQ